jgi:hypothetical protein
VRSLTPSTGCRRAVSALSSVLALWSVATPALAQDRLATHRSIAIAPMFQSWSFGDGLIQTTLRGDTVRASRATQISIPVVAQLRFGDRWQLDLGAAVVDSRVTLEGRDATIDVDEYSLRGLTDVKVGLTAHVIPDQLLFTVGLNAAPGGTELEPGELEALRVFAAPALGYGVPSMGLGRAATAGVVFARHMAGWAWAFGGSYELRSGSTPLVISSGLPAVDFNPSDAIHLTVGTEGLVGSHAMTVGLSADIFSDDDYSSGGEEITSAATRLGPILTAEWQLRLATPRLRELVVYATDRYRTKYSRADAKVPNSAANYLDVGVSGVAPLSSRVGLVMGIALRHHSGLEADSSAASAAARIGGASIGLQYDRGIYRVEPMVRMQLGRLDTFRATADVREVVAGIVVARRF